MTARNDVRRGRLDGRADAHADRGFAAETPKAAAKNDISPALME